MDRLEALDVKFLEHSRPQWYMPLAPGEGLREPSAQRRCEGGSSSPSPLASAGVCTVSGHSQRRSQRRSSGS